MTGREPALGARLIHSKQDSRHFRNVVASIRTGNESDAAKETVSLPVIEALSGYLVNAHVGWTHLEVCWKLAVEGFSDHRQTVASRLSILRALGNLVHHDTDASVLIAKQSALIPSIIHLLYTYSAKILGVASNVSSREG